MPAGSRYRRSMAPLASQASLSLKTFKLFGFVKALDLLVCELLTRHDLFPRLLANQGLTGGRLLKFHWLLFDWSWMPLQRVGWQYVVELHIDLHELVAFLYWLAVRLQPLLQGRADRVGLRLRLW